MAQERSVAEAEGSYEDEGEHRARAGQPDQAAEGPLHASEAAASVKAGSALLEGERAGWL